MLMENTEVQRPALPSSIFGVRSLFALQPVRPQLP